MSWRRNSKADEAADAAPAVGEGFPIRRTGGTHMTLLTSAARNFSANVASVGVTLLDRVILVGLLVRSWGPEVYADWAILFSMCSLLVVTEGGAQILLGNSLSRSGARGYTRSFQRFVGLGISFYIGLSFLIVCATVAVALWGDVGARLHVSTIGKAAEVFALLCLYSMLKVVRSSWAQVFRGKGDAHRLLWITPRATGAAVLFAALSVAAGATPLQLAFVYLLSEAVFGVLWSITEVRRRYPEVLLQPKKPTRVEVKTATAAALWYSWPMLTTQLMVHLPIIIVGILGFRGGLVTTFILTRTLINISKMLAISVTTAAGLELVRARDLGRESAYRTGVLGLSRFNTVLVAVTAVGLIVFSPRLIAVWTGRSDLSSQPVLLMLLASLVLTAPALPLQMLAQFGSMPKPLAMANAVQAILSLGLAAVGGSLFGLLGLVAGMAVGEIAGLGVLLPRLVSGPLGVTYSSMVVDSLVQFVAAGSWALFLAVLASALPSPDSSLGFLALLTTWGAASFGPPLFLSLPREIRGGLWRRMQTQLVRTSIWTHRS